MLRLIVSSQLLEHSYCRPLILSAARTNQRHMTVPVTSRFQFMAQLQCPVGSDCFWLTVADPSGRARHGHAAASAASAAAAAGAAAAAAVTWLSLQLDLLAVLRNVAQ